MASGRERLRKWPGPSSGCVIKTSGKEVLNRSLARHSQLLRIHISIGENRADGTRRSQSQPQKPGRERTRLVQLGLVLCLSTLVSPALIGGMSASKRVASGRPLLGDEECERGCSELDRCTEKPQALCWLWGAH